MDVFENLALNLIVRKEVNDYLKKYQEKLKNIEKIKKMITGAGSTTNIDSAANIIKSK